MEVKLSDEADDEFKELNTVIQSRVLKVLKRLSNWPRVSGVKSLTGRWQGYRRIRTGDYRIIFEVEPDRIRVVRIAIRRDVYN